MKVHRGVNTDNCWQIRHRYSEFATLHAQLTPNLVGLELAFPPKKAFGNMDNTFLQERRIGLQNFIDSILSNSLFNSHILVKKFLDPYNYSDKIEVLGQQQAAMFFRSEPNWELQENLKEIGWRVRKHFFSLKSKEAGKGVKLSNILSYVEHGPDMVLDHEASLLAILKQITTLKHPHICPTIYASCTEKGATIVRQFHMNGSLRDAICKAKPFHPRLKKYSNFRLRVQLDVSEIKRIGRQVLEALKFLKDKGLPYGHLHAGNVIVEGRDCKLLDIENGVLGLPSLYRSFITQIKSIKDVDAIDVYCFGQFLYEITFGVPLGLPSVENLPSNCPPMLQPILHLILSNTAVKTGLPSIEDLISNPFFADVQINFGGEKPYFKVSKLKESLKQAREAIEARLKEDQKTYRQFMRLSKARSELLSDEEKRKRKKSSKKKVSKQEDTQKTPQSNSTTSGPPASTTSPFVPSPPPPPPPQITTNPTTSKPPVEQPGRGALLSSISGFNKVGLKKAETNDRSAPKL